MASSASSSIAMLPGHIAMEIFREVGRTKKVTDGDLRRLHFLFQEGFAKAVDMIDSEFVTTIIAPSGRYYWEVEGSAPFAYVVWPHYCSCPAFTNTVLLRPLETPFCKHQLAAMLAHACGRTKIKEVEEAVWMTTLANERNRAPTFNRRSNAHTNVNTGSSTAATSMNTSSSSSMGAPTAIVSTSSSSSFNAVGAAPSRMSISPSAEFGD